MDQLRQVGEFIWKWRFWFTLGIVAILALVIQPTGTSRIHAQVETTKRQLDGAYQQIAPFVGGNQHPNPTWIEEVQKKEQQANQEVTTVQESIFLEQRKLMTWPDRVAKVFAPRGFNTLLDDEQGRLLFFYFQDFDQQVKDLLQIVDPIELNSEEEVVGKMVARIEVLDRPDWKKAPDSQEAWLAQEQIWIQRAMLEAIARANADAKSWYDAPIKTLLAIKIGTAGIDTRRINERADIKLQALPPLPGAPPPPPGARASTPQTSGGLNPERYLDFTPEFRSIPVHLALQVDQRMLADVLAAIGSADFGFVIGEVSWKVPTDKPTIPAELEDATGSAVGSAREALDNIIELRIWGDVRIYEMPQSLKQKEEAAAAAAAAGTPAPGTEPAADAGSAPAPGAEPGSPATPPATPPPGTPPAESDSDSPPAASPPATPSPGAPPAGPDSDSPPAAPPPPSPAAPVPPSAPPAGAAP